MRKNVIDTLLVKLKLSKHTKFAEEKAGDRVIYTPAENFGFDVEVYEVDEDGNKVPLIDGEYTFDNGVKIVVVDGKVKEFIEPDGNKEELSEEEEVVEDIKEDTIDGVEDLIENLVEQVLEIRGELTELKSKFEDVDKEKEELKTKLSKSPSVPQTKKSEFSSVKKSNDLGVDYIMDVFSKRSKF